MKTILYRSGMTAAIAVMLGTTSFSWDAQAQDAGCVPTAKAASKMEALRAQLFAESGGTTRVWVSITDRDQAQAAVRVMSQDYDAAVHGRIASIHFLRLPDGGSRVLVGINGDVCGFGSGIVAPPLIAAAALQAAEDVRLAQIGGTHTDRPSPAGDFVEDEGNAADETEQGFGEAIQGLSTGYAMTCTFSLEEASRPGARMLLRGTARSDYQGDIPESHSFTWDGTGSLSINGSPSALLYREGELVGARLMTAPVPAQPLPDTFTDEEQEGWQKLQGIVRGMNRIGGEATGLSDRVVILDFAKRTGVIATWLDGQLSEAKAVGCM